MYGKLWCDWMVLWIKPDALSSLTSSPSWYIYMCGMEQEAHLQCSEPPDLISRSRGLQCDVPLHNYICAINHCERINKEHSYGLRPTWQFRRRGVCVCVYIYHVSVSLTCTNVLIACLCPLKPSGRLLYYGFNIHKFCLLPTRCIYVSDMVLRTNIAYFAVGH